jgi:hypothetical protein
MNVFHSLLEGLFDWAFRLNLDNYADLGERHFHFMNLLVERSSENQV